MQYLQPQIYLQLLLFCKVCCPNAGFRDEDDRALRREQLYNDKYAENEFVNN